MSSCLHNVRRRKPAFASVDIAHDDGSGLRIKRNIVVCTSILLQFTSTMLIKVLLEKFGFTLYMYLLTQVPIIKILVQAGKSELMNPHYKILQISMISSKQDSINELRTECEVQLPHMDSQLFWNYKYVCSMYVYYYC